MSHPARRGDAGGGLGWQDSSFLMHWSAAKGGSTEHRRQMVLRQRGHMNISRISA